MLPATTLDAELALDAIQPVQFTVLWHGRATTSPERKLLLAMVAQAAGDLHLFRHRRNAKSRRLYNDAREWVLSDSRAHMFAFVSICDILGFAPNALRAAILGGVAERTAIAA
jgi:hypothetical protein